MMLNNVSWWKCGYVIFPRVEELDWTTLCSSPRSHSWYMKLSILSHTVDGTRRSFLILLWKSFSSSGAKDWTWDLLRARHVLLSWVMTSFSCLIPTVCRGTLAGNCLFLKLPFMWDTVGKPLWETVVPLAGKICSWQKFFFSLSIQIELPTLWTRTWNGTALMLSVTSSIRN